MLQQAADFSNHLCFVAGLELKIRLAGAYLRQLGLPDYFALCSSHLLQVRLPVSKHKDGFIFSRIYNRAFLGDNKGKF
jgi:hypothetical protein